jgi:hypothetical protein
VNLIYEKTGNASSPMSFPYLFPSRTWPERLQDEFEIAMKGVPEESTLKRNPAAEIDYEVS